MRKAAVILGSDSDLPIARPCVARLKEWGVAVTARVISAHRTPETAAAFAREARAAGYGVLIAFAGKAAHLAGALAANTTLPVIGVPVSSSMDGLDALLSTAQMPPGVPVATVGVDAGLNAAILAVEMLSLSDPALAETLRKSRADMASGVAEKDARVQAEFA